MRLRTPPAFVSRPLHSSQTGCFPLFDRSLASRKYCAVATYRKSVLSCARLANFATWLRPQHTTLRGHSRRRHGIGEVAPTLNGVLGNQLPLTNNPAPW